ncbi:class II fructose-1,6-bisphosphate aldolase [Mycoplasma sp. Mirounga ES2805-ORL]|uniref:class II fructose-1,6-bisphosphate aldolase n=1 Tax=Mycoplasma sp. Mirounga ES2805-ORL TaxID=754514 RepID=UPI00197B6ED2|nr:class II fructose-1,6-bisphosphate aldolase [Mycoplasma sp. Mirounga ES2805-ORL]QSF13488.1 class II fructose-1,6-bisphosphate aldolase [Mycoplasma sp. Mirounga ES2805-ORL]
MKLVNAKDMVTKAFENQYAVPHININNLEWTKAALITAQKLNSPLILGTSEGAIKYMTGFKTVYGMVSGMMEDLNITVPVALHLDHGSFEACLKAIEVGYTSVMFDGSHFPFLENIKLTKEVVKAAKKKNVSVEAEIGTIGSSTSDNDVTPGELADRLEAIEMAKLGIDFLAAGIGNIHGPYPKSWKSLDFDKLKEIKEATNIGLVLHGGSGIPKEQISKAISLGISKININTELQQANHKAIRQYIESGEDLKGKNFDPRKFLKPGFDAMCDIVEQKILECGSQNKA